jgi:hypothetical protein
VIRFKRGRYTMEAVVEERGAERAVAALTGRLIAEDDARYKKELSELEAYYRDRPPPSPPPAPYVPPPPMTQEEWDAFWAEQPPLRTVEVERTNADTVWLRITGRVMLNGGCGSGMPLFNIEMRNDTGWVDRILFEWTQMDCGMPWGDWEDRVVMLPPLRWWVGANSPAATRELLPGTYRIVLMGGNMQVVRSPSFTLP